MAELAPLNEPSTPPPRLLIPVGTRVRVWVQSDDRPGGGDWRFGEIIGGNLLDSGEQLSNVRLEHNRGDCMDVPIWNMRWEKDLDHRAPFTPRKARWEAGFHAVYVYAGKCSRVMTTPTEWREGVLVVGWSTPDKGMQSITKGATESWEHAYNRVTGESIKCFLSNNLALVRGWHQHLDPELFEKDSAGARLKQFQAPSAIEAVKGKVDYDCEHSYVKLETCFQITYHGHTEHELNWPMAGTEDMERLGFQFEYETPQMRQVSSFK